MILTPVVLPDSGWDISYRESTSSKENCEELPTLLKEGDKG
jgi:hypothetical protein